MVTLQLGKQFEYLLIHNPLKSSNKTHTLKLITGCFYACALIKTGLCPQMLWSLCYLMDCNTLIMLVSHRPVFRDHQPFFFFYSELDILDYKKKTKQQNKSTNQHIILKMIQTQIRQDFQKSSNPMEGAYIRVERLQDVQCLILQPLNSPTFILNVSTTANKPSDDCIFLLCVIFEKWKLKEKKKSSFSNFAGHTHLQCLKNYFQLWRPANFDSKSYHISRQTIMQDSIQSGGVFPGQFCTWNDTWNTRNSTMRRSQAQEQGGQEQDFTLWNAADPHSSSAIKRCQERGSFTFQGKINRQPPLPLWQSLELQSQWKGTYIVTPQI